MKKHQLLFAVVEAIAKTDKLSDAKKVRALGALRGADDGRLEQWLVGKASTFITQFTVWDSTEEGYDFWNTVADAVRHWEKRTSKAGTPGDSCQA